MQSYIVTQNSPPGDPGQGRPEFIRLPRSGTRCPHTGLSRAALNELILGEKPLVKSVVLRKREALRGIRMIYLASLLDHLRGVMAEQMAEKGGSDE